MSGVSQPLENGFFFHIASATVYLINSIYSRIPKISNNTGSELVVTIDFGAR